MTHNFVPLFNEPKVLISFTLISFSDECFEVEQQCQHVISEIEQVLGEPLQKYF